ncbi:alginate O-acetyltransferase AlgX-related protein [Deinococcus humi]|uniref:AlgX/AlgJ SGNH hydrolase-like domain-containing protein n=1 Tax=Deinococcus humi TaxID=662880 RepID=A0A7W8JVF8_9DEIO|nr:hypothetical protein [Deinococcus humi]MBB5363972.1 hypothetical protein [Deinococcus humi]GGO32796.1 hypothetical protein GCM10008949_30950 [Deinococcus humi]
MKRLMMLSTLLLGMAGAQDLPRVVKGKSGWLFTNEELQKFPATENVYLEQMGAIAQVVRLLREQGIEVAILVAPTKASIYPEFLPENLKSNLDYKGNYEKILDDFKRMGVSSVNLKSPLIAQKSEGLLYLKTDTHWSPFGMKVASEAVAKAMKDQLKKFPEVDFSAEYLPPILPTSTDLLAQLPENQQVDFEKDPISGLRITSSEVNLLDETPPSAITLLGTSYSTAFDGRGLPAAYEKIFGKTLAIAAKRDVLNYAVGAKGFWQPVVDYVRSEEYQLRPPKLILWEIPERYLSFEAPPQWAIPSFPWLENEITGGKNDCLRNFANCNKTSSTMKYVMGWRVLDIVGGVNIYRATTEGFFDREGPIRHGGPERSAVSFWLPTSQTVKLDLALTSPVEQQRVQVFLNDKLINTTSQKLNDQYEYHLSLPASAGQNLLEFRYSNWNGKTALFPSGEMRKIAVTFFQLKLTR